MLNLMLYMVALITGMLSFSGIAGSAGSTMFTLFSLSLVLLVASMLTRGFKRNIVWY